MLVITGVCMVQRRRSTACHASQHGAQRRSQTYNDLFSALTTTFRRDTLPWLTDLVNPFLAGPPPPLTDTQDPRSLADPDSLFVDVSYPEAGTVGTSLCIHYKEWVGVSSCPEPLAPPPDQAAASGASDEDVGQVGACGSDGSTGSDGSGLFRSGSADRAFGRDSETLQGRQQPQQLATVSLAMLHGFNGSEFNFRQVAQPIACKVAQAAWLRAHEAAAQDSQTQYTCRAVAYDRPPFGLSSRPASWPDPGSPTDPYTVTGGEGIRTYGSMPRVLAA